jgi:hypothetical protein
MLWKPSALAAAAATITALAAGASARGYDDCGSHPPPGVIGKLIDDLDSILYPATHPLLPEIPVHFHVALREDDDPKLVATEAKLREQMKLVHDTCEGTSQHLSSRERSS